MRDSGLTMYAIAQGANIRYAQVHRFMAGEGTWTMDTLDRACEFLGLELKPKR
jgi:hypothetical protein